MDHQTEKTTRVTDDGLGGNPFEGIPLKDVFEFEEQRSQRDFAETERARRANMESSPAPADSPNPKDLIGQTKPRLSLVPPALALYTAGVMELGAKKYGPYNWRKHKVLRTVYIEAAMRHLAALLDGEDLDPESGFPHEGHVASCMGIILDAQASGQLIDDRPTKGPASTIIKQLTRTKQP